MRFAALVVGFLLPLFAFAEAAPAAPKAPAAIEEGKQYEVLEGAAKPVPGAKIEVTEVFWYGCGHCYAFEPILEPWVKKLPADVKFTRSPAIWPTRRPGMPEDLMKTHAKLYYTALAMNAVDKLHQPLFDALQKEGKGMYEDAEIAAVVKAAGVDGDKFVATMKSFAVNSQVTQADARQKAFKVSGTPEIVVANYYKISASAAGGQKEMLDVADFLIKKLQAAK
ncbi:MAG TPA: thiol:disulfide interchange protein DsbA/DsbL [Cellvibrionaceae bacterium]|nr:thiol:disulfide interchange protein DsbA/DsbL [Cellvibrionaceae bacterium]HMW71233.1 thiol:disulfide interchange protein DsbA/DsbL [Cellvibrionaceae bacterium]HMY37933.1 thiol:disulfide interchange protein DsbA/DsbL [Marinagarivorans sp.]HNG58251.1 thiol:disulfide interchange protein DsbA/DsbL [Cellvibrionaceae bacterium]